MLYNVNRIRAAEPPPVIVSWFRQSILPRSNLSQSLEQLNGENSEKQIRKYLRVQDKIDDLQCDQNEVSLTAGEVPYLHSEKSEKRHHSFNNVFYNRRKHALTQEGNSQRLLLPSE